MVINALLKHWSYRIIAPGTLLREQYEALRRLLHHDISCHEQMAELQELLQVDKAEDFARTAHRLRLFSKDVAAMVDSLGEMNPGKYSALKSYHKKFDFYIRFLLAPPKIDVAPPYTLSLERIDGDTPNIGHKAGHLARLKNELNIPVPRGFVVTANGCNRFIEHNDLRGAIDKQLISLDIHSPKSLAEVSKSLQILIERANIPPELDQEILASYDRLFNNAPPPLSTPVAVRSSAICEDGEHSFAGQFATLLNVNRDGLLAAYRKVLASKYSAEALYYRVRQGVSDEESAMAVLIMEMVPAVCSGVVYTGDIASSATEEDVIHLHAIDGLAERLVGGEEVPLHYKISRQQPHGIISAPEGKQLITGDQAASIGGSTTAIEHYFGALQDIEWAIDSTGKAFILQARTLYLQAPETAPPPLPAPAPSGKPLLEKCERASTGVGSGVIYRLDANRNLADVPDKAVLLTRTTPAKYVQLLDRVSAVVSESGSRASHFATVAREFGIPFLCSIPDVCDKLAPGLTVTVDGDTGTVYEGCIETIRSREKKVSGPGRYQRVIREVLKFVTPLELVDPAGDNFVAEGCRSMHDIIRFCHEKALYSLFTSGRPGTGKGSRRLAGDIPLDVYIFDVGGGISQLSDPRRFLDLDSIYSVPFLALWQGLSHPDVQWKQKPFDWQAHERIELSGGVAPKRDSFAFASYAVIGRDYLHFNLRFGYHFTIVDAICGKTSSENHLQLRFAGGGGDLEHRGLRLDFLDQVMTRLGFDVDKKGDLLEARVLGTPENELVTTLDMLGRLLGATKLMDMVLEDDQMVDTCVEEFFRGRYSFSQEG